METTEKPQTPAEAPPVRRPSIKVIIALAVGIVIAIIALPLIVGTSRPGTVVAAIPGFLVNLVSGQKSYVNGLLAALAGLGTAIFAEWHHYPFPSDESFGFFIQNLKGLGTVTFTMLWCCTAAGFFFGTNFFKPSKA